VNASVFQHRENPAGKRLALVLALAVHLFLAALLFYGVQWQTQAPGVVEVELVRAVPLPAAVPPAPTFTPPPEPRPEPRPEPKPESKPVPPKADIAVKTEPPPKAEPKPRLDAFLDQLKQETQRLIQRKQSDATSAALDKEIASREAAARARATADYIAKIRGKIRGNLVVPPGVPGNPEAVFAVTQLPSGEILNVRLKHTSGHAALDTAIERAIRKSSPLPKPEQGDLFSRDLELKFRPLED
jgi:colicin import membrane protein